MKRLRFVDYFLCLFVCLFCFLSWNCRVIINNFITFLSSTKDLQFSLFISIFTFYFEFYIFFLPIILLLIYFNRFFRNYQWAECFHSTLAGFFLDRVHWQWPWTLLRKVPRVLGDVLHSVMFPFLLLCNILTLECIGVFRV